MRIVKLICIASFLSIFVGCVNNGSSSKQQSESPTSPKYDRTPFAVYVYDSNKEIVLYDNPRTATVDGISGCWFTTTSMQLPEDKSYTRIPLHYIIHYGETEKICIVGAESELVFFWKRPKCGMAELEQRKDMEELRKEEIVILPIVQLYKSENHKRRKILRWSDMESYE